MILRGKSRGRALRRTDFRRRAAGKSSSDYSGLHRIAGLAAVKRQIQAGLAVARGNVAEDN